MPSGCHHMNRDVVDLDWLYFSVPGNALMIFYPDLKQLFQKVGRMFRLLVLPSPIKVCRSQILPVRAAFIFISSNLAAGCESIQPNLEIL